LLNAHSSIENSCEINRSEHKEETSKAIVKKNKKKNSNQTSEKPVDENSASNHNELTEE
jgi:hypothetical protein